MSVRVKNVRDVFAGKNYAEMYVFAPLLRTFRAFWRNFVDFWEDFAGLGVHLENAKSCKSRNLGGGGPGRVRIGVGSRQKCAGCVCG